MKRKIGLYFGSFNPVHIGHLILANHLVEHSDLDEIWFVVTPQNPFKEKKTLLDNANRLEMVSLCLKEYEKLRPCDIEFHLSQPNYTIDTLIYMEEKYPQYTFALIMGEDNLKSFTKWKKTPIIEISATAIREDIALDKNVKPLLPTEVWNYIDKWGFYK